MKSGASLLSGHAKMFALLACIGLLVLADLFWLPSTRTDAAFIQLEQTTIEHVTRKGYKYYEAGPSYIHLSRGRAIKTWWKAAYYDLKEGQPVQVFRSKLFGMPLKLNFETRSAFVRRKENPALRQPAIGGALIVFIICFALLFFFRDRPHLLRQKIAATVIGYMSFAVAIIMLFYTLF